MYATDAEEPYTKATSNDDSEEYGYRAILSFLTYFQPQLLRPITGVFPILYSLSRPHAGVSRKWKDSTTARWSSPEKFDSETEKDLSDLEEEETSLFHVVQTSKAQSDRTKNVNVKIPRYDKIIDSMMFSAYDIVLCYDKERSRIFLKKFLVIDIGRIRLNMIK